MVSTLLPLLALAAVSAALQVTSPTSSDVWTVGDSQTVKWDTVSSDQDSFDIYLSNMASYPTTTILLASDVSSSSGSATIDGSKLTSGNSFTINFTNGTETAQIYAQSNQFNITASSSSSSSSSSSAASSTAASSSSTGTTATFTLSKVSASSAGSTAVATTSANSTTTGSSTATTSDSSATASSTAASSSGSSASGTASSSSSSSSSTSTSSAGKIVAGWMGAIAVAVLAL